MKLAIFISAIALAIIDIVWLWCALIAYKRCEDEYENKHSK